MCLHQNGRVCAPVLRTVLLLLTLAGCGKPAGGSAGEETAPAPPGRPKLERAATRLDTMQVEGMWDTVTVHLFRTPAGFALPFSTYVPRDLLAEPAPEEGTVRFVANFDERRNDSVQVAIRAHPGGTSETQARAALAAALGGRKVARDENRMTTWSVEEYDLQDLDMTGRGMLGRHGDRWFHVVIRFPSEYADGFGPRVRIILQEWRWADTGEPLGT